MIAINHSLVGMAEQPGDQVDIYKLADELNLDNPIAMWDVIAAYLGMTGELGDPPDEVDYGPLKRLKSMDDLELLCKISHARWDERVMENTRTRVSALIPPSVFQDKTEKKTNSTSPYRRD